MEQQPQAIFAQQIDRYTAEARATEAQLVRIAWTRLGLFALALTLEIMSWRWGGLWWLLVIALFLLAFGLVVKWYQRIDRIKQYQLELKRINQEELDRLDHKLEGLDGGEEFADRKHPYSSDLDLFGERSLFAYLSRATTVFGRRQLADYLRNPADREGIAQRQASVEELAPQLDWRQNLQATGRMTEQGEDRTDFLQKWGEQAPVIRKDPLFRWVPWILSPLALVTIVAGFAELIPLWTGLIALTINYLFNRRIMAYSQQVYRETESSTRALRAYGNLLAQIENAKFKTPLLQQVQTVLQGEGPKAHAEIAGLVRILTNLELRMNGLPYFIMQHLFFWDIFWIGRLELWKRRNGRDLIGWFEMMGQVEALNSLAALRFAHPDWTVPEVAEEGFVIAGEALGHPMLPQTVRVSNPIAIERAGLIWLITGSNMSGKSTYLRTVGINAVLALAGAPACAARFRITPMQVLTSMRTLDSLEESTSSFYAELKRLKMVIERVETGEPVLFLLDEILKGTNSRDRHAGAKALIHQLQANGGSGLVSTHDLELVEMAEALPGDIVNYSFNCDVGTDGELHFNYALTDGVCQSMNATELMKAMGIRM
ncbi:MAG: hypothetical protein AAF998_06250 [Bacteroidota bacterium]